MTTPAEPAAPNVAKSCLLMVAGFVLLVALIMWAMASAGADMEVTQVTVSDTRQTDGDPEYAVVGDATVEWDENGDGGVSVNIKDTGSEDYRSPLLEATVHYEDGYTVDCDSRKSVIWGGSELAFLGCSGVLVSMTIDHVDIRRL